MMDNVICFGALNVDKLYTVNQIAKAEEESEILDLKEFPGGSAANTAVGLARLGVKTGYIGKIAEDREGEFLLNSLKKEGVNTDGIIISKKGKSGVVLGFVDQEGERALYLNPGVNDSIAFNEISLEYLAGAKFLHLTSFAGEKSFHSQLKLVQEIPNINVTLDPGMIYSRKGWREMKPLINKCFALLPNENELRLLTGKDYKKGAEALLHAGVKLVAVKRGKKGCYVMNNEESHLIAPYNVKVVDSTGAGDAFCAGFLYGLLEHRTLRECGLLGNFVASKVIINKGARNGLPQIEDIAL